MFTHDQLKDLIHNSYVLNYVMWKLGFWKMRIYEPEHKWNHYKIKLYYYQAGKLKKSTFMTFDAKDKPHVYVSTDYRFKSASNEDISFSIQQRDFDIIVAKNIFLNILKEIKMFKWKDIEFFTTNSKHQDFDELLVKADLEQDDFQMNDENYVLNYIERTIKISF